MTTAYEPRPTREILDLFPHQGHWAAAEDMALDTNRLIEFTKGYLEFLPTPDELHQDIATDVFALAQRVAANDEPRAK